MKAALQAGGYDGTITLDPRGANAPFVADAGFSKDEQWQMDRRIEMEALRIENFGANPEECS